MTIAPADYQSVQAQLLAWFSEMHFEVHSAEADLFDSGIIDSQRLVELLLHIEQKFDIKFDVGDFEIESFRCIQKIAALVLQHQSEKTAPQLTKVF
jgi:acyl carrier protein